MVKASFLILLLFSLSLSSNLPHAFGQTGEERSIPELLRELQEIIEEVDKRFRGAGLVDEISIRPAQVNPNDLIEIKIKIGSRELPIDPNKIRKELDQLLDMYRNHLKNKGYSERQQEIILERIKALINKWDDFYEKLTTQPKSQVISVIREHFFTPPPESGGAVSPTPKRPPKRGGFVRLPSKLPPKNPGIFSRVWRGVGRILGFAGDVSTVALPPLILLEFRHCQELKKELLELENRRNLMISDLDRLSPEKHQQVYNNLEQVDQQIVDIKRELEGLCRIFVGYTPKEQRILDELRAMMEKERKRDTIKTPERNHAR